MIETYDLAFAMFMRRCELDECEPALAELMWHTDVELQRFWVEEANFVLSFVQGAAA